MMERIVLFMSYLSVELQVKLLVCFFFDCVLLAIFEKW